MTVYTFRAIKPKLNMYINDKIKKMISFNCTKQMQKYHSVAQMSDKFS